MYLAIACWRLNFFPFNCLLRSRDHNFCSASVVVNLSSLAYCWMMAFEPWWRWPRYLRFNSSDFSSIIPAQAMQFTPTSAEYFTFKKLFFSFVYLRAGLTIFPTWRLCSLSMWRGRGKVDYRSDARVSRMSINVHLKYFDIPSITTESANEHGENKPQRLFASPCSLCLHGKKH